MKKSSKIFLILLTISLFTISLRTIVLAKGTIPSATKDFYVNDFAEVFTSDEKEALMNNAVNFAKETEGVQVVVTTVKSLQGESVEDYAYDMYNQYKIGKDDMGLLILLSTEDRKIRVEVGKAMEIYINDAKAGRFIDQYAIPSLKQNKFNEGLIKLQKAFIKEIEQSIKEKTEKNSSNETQTGLDLDSIMALSIVSGVVGIIILIIWALDKAKGQNGNIQRLNQKVEELQNDLKLKTSKLETEKIQLSRNLSNVKEKYNLLYDRYQRGKNIYPDLDEKIDKIIEEEIRQANMQKAEKLDLAVQKVMKFKPNKDIVDETGRVIKFYNSLNQNQKQYVKSNIESVKKLYKKSLELKNKDKALSVQKTIEAMIVGISIGRAYNYKKIKQAMNMYEDLNSEEKKYFDSSIANRIEDLLRQAKMDKKREEEEERRRHSYYYSSGSSGGSSGFGGFGGSSGGGGASRGF